MVGSYSYRDEVKQKHYTAEGDKSKMFTNIYECVFLQIFTEEIYLQIFTNIFTGWIAHSVLHC